MTTTYPIVTTAQNGPNSASTDAIAFDGFGRPTWTKDTEGFLTYTAYDPATGAVVKTIDDVDSSLTGTFAGLPSGWSTPGGGGLQLVTTATVDLLGRTTKLTDPLGNITYTVYNDTNYEVRVYPGWTGSTTTGPTIVTREDRSNSYDEVLTMSATPSVASSAPTGAESIANVQSLSRTHRNASGQVDVSDVYTSFTGTYIYSTANPSRMPPICARR